MNRIMIAATHSGAGKTTITCGIIRALSNKNLRVQPYKVGPDYIDTSYHMLASGKISRNLDEFILPAREIKNIFAINSDCSDISVVEGVMGLFDGYQADTDYCSSASMAKLLGCPVILVIDAKAMAGSVAAIASGFADFDNDLDIRGFILNNVSTESHYDILKTAIENKTGIEVLGRLPKSKEVGLPSRHLGLVMQNELEDSEDKIQRMAQLVEENIDLQRIIEISSINTDFHNERKIQKNYTDLTLAIAKDEAFNFYYQDSIDFLSELGLKIEYFSPLNDEKVPDCDGIYIGGGYPEIFAERLSENAGIREHIKKLSDSGLPIYAECGGLMYLGDSLIDTEKKEYSMCSVLQGKSIMSTSLKRFGYCSGEFLEETILGSKTEVIRGHEFHHSVFETDLEPVYQMKKEKSDKTTDIWSGGYKVNNTFASYLHTHFCSDYKIAYNFCDAMERYSESDN